RGPRAAARPSPGGIRAETAARNAPRRAWHQAPPAQDPLPPRAARAHRPAEAGLRDPALEVAARGPLAPDRRLPLAFARARGGPLRPRHGVDHGGQLPRRRAGERPPRRAEGVAAP